MSAHTSREFRVSRFMDAFNSLAIERWREMPPPSNISYVEEVGLVFPFYKAKVAIGEYDGGEDVYYPETVYLMGKNYLYDPKETTSEIIERVCFLVDIDESEIIEILKSFGLCRQDWEPHDDDY